MAQNNNNGNNKGSKNKYDHASGDHGSDANGKTRDIDESSKAATNGDTSKREASKCFAPISAFLNKKIIGKLVLKHKTKFEAVMGSSADGTQEEEGRGSGVDSRARNLRRVKAMTCNLKKGGGKKHVYETSTLTYQYPLFKLYCKDELLDRGDHLEELTTSKQESRSKAAFIKDLKALLAMCKKSKHCWYSDLCGMAIPEVLKHKGTLDLFLSVMERLQGGYLVKKYTVLDLEDLSDRMGFQYDFLFRFFWKAMTPAERTSNKEQKWLFKDALEIVFKELTLKRALLVTLQAYCSEDSRTSKEFNRQSDHQYRWLVDRSRISHLLEDTCEVEAMRLDFPKFVRTMERECTKLMDVDSKNGERGAMYSYYPRQLILTTETRNFRSIDKDCKAFDQAFLDALDTKRETGVSKGLLTKHDEEVIMQTFFRALDGANAFIRWQGGSEGCLSTLDGKVEDPMICITYEYHLVSDDEKKIYDDWKKPFKVAPKVAPKQVIELVDGQSGETVEDHQNTRMLTRPLRRNVDTRRNAKRTIESYVEEISSESSSEESEYHPDEHDCEREENEEVVDFDRLSEMESDEDSDESTECYEDDDAVEEKVDDDDASGWETYREESFDEEDMIEEREYKLDKRRERAEEVAMRKRGESAFTNIVDIVKPIKVTEVAKPSEVVDLTKSEKRKRDAPDDGANASKKRKVMNWSDGLERKLAALTSDSLVERFMRVYQSMLSWHENNWVSLPPKTQDYGVDQGYYWKHYARFFTYLASTTGLACGEDCKNVCDLFKTQHVRDLKIPKTHNGQIYSLLYLPSSHGVACQNETEPWMHSHLVPSSKTHTMFAELQYLSYP